MRRGKVSYSKVRAVTRVATPENEQTLLDVALAGTAAHVERTARAWRRIDRNVEQAGGTAAEREPGAADVGGRERDGGRPSAVDAGGWGGASALEAACDQARPVPASNGGAEEEGADLERETAHASGGAEEPAVVDILPFPSAIQVRVFNDHGWGLLGDP